MFRLDLTADDINTIRFVGNRYSWSDCLINVGVSEGVNELTEYETWEIKESIEADMEDGHDSYPMLDPSSDLCDKLHNLYLSSD